MTVSVDGVGGDDMERASGQQPRWQRGQYWPRARAAACLRPSPPLESSHFLCASVREREPGAVQAPDATHRLWLSLWLAAPRPSRHRVAGHGPALGPPGGLDPQPLARYVSPLSPYSSGSPSLVLLDLSSNCEERDETRLP